jgi:hypothetical protein
MNPKTRAIALLVIYITSRLAPRNAQTVNIVELYVRGREMFYAQN